MSPTDSPTFPPAAPSDIDVLLPLMRQFYIEEGYPFDESLTCRNLNEFLAAPSLGRIWLVAADAAPVGYVVLTLSYSFEFGGLNAFIDELFLLPSHRNRGLGAAALSHAESACRELGVKALHLEVERAKESARRLYRKHGFADHDRYLMTKWIGGEGPLLEPRNNV